MWFLRLLVILGALLFSGLGIYEIVLIKAKQSFDITSYILFFLIFLANITCLSEYMINAARKSAEETHDKDTVRTLMNAAKIKRK